MKNTLFTLLLIVLAGVLAVALWGSPEATPHPYITVIALLLAGGLLWFAGNAALAVRRYPVGIAWLFSLRAVGWVGLVVSAAFIVLLLISPAPEATRSAVPWGDPARVVAFVVPLALAVQAALVFAPDDEPALEVLLACPRPVAWILIERLAALFVAQTGIALAGMALTIQLAGSADILALLMRWLPPALLLGGVAVYTTQRTRVSAFGIVVAGLIWFGALFFGSALLPGVPTMRPFNHLQPLLWVVHPYLEAGILPTGDYWLNRFCVMALGINLIALAALLLRDEERLLLSLRQTTRE